MPKSDLVWQPVGAPRLLSPELRDIFEKEHGMSGGVTSIRIDKSWEQYLVGLKHAGVPGLEGLIAAIKEYEVVEVSIRERL